MLFGDFVKFISLANTGKLLLVCLFFD